MDPTATPPAPRPPSDSALPRQSPPRAFTQGVGTLYQFVGVMLFLASMSVCCGSSLLSKDAATRQDLMAVGWIVPLPGGPYFHSAQRAISAALVLAVFFGIALAGIGLGLQAQRRFAPWAAVAVTSFATLFWLVHAVFFGTTLGSPEWVTGSSIAAFGFGMLTAFALAALREMRRDPPPRGHEILPADYNVPYSHLHQDPPEVRWAKELDQRREQLAVQQKELELLEARLQRKLDAGPAAGDNPALRAADATPWHVKDKRSE